MYYHQKTYQSESVVGSDVDIIDKKIISDSSVLFGDILDNNLNGINYFQSGGYGTISGIQLRGRKARYSTVYIDGVKFQTLLLHPMIIILTILSGSFDKVEILKGAQSSLYVVKAGWTTKCFQRKVEIIIKILTYQQALLVPRKLI